MTRVRVAALGALLYAMGAVAAESAAAPTAYDDWQRVSAAELESRRGGLRVHGFEIAIALRVREMLNGAPVLESRLVLSPGQNGRTWEGAETSRAFESADGRTRLRHDIGASGVHLWLENSANQVEIRREIDLHVALEALDTARQLEAAHAVRRLTIHLEQRRWTR